MLTIDRRGDSGIFAPSHTQPFPYKSAVASKSFAPSGETKGVAVNGNRSHSFVGALFGACSPSTIFWCVITIVINAVNSVFTGRLVSHIINKCLGAVKPPITNCYASTSVVIKSHVVGVSASFNHAPPRIKKWMFSQSMCSSGIAEYFLLQASARLASSIGKPFGITDSLVATDADAVPHGSPTSVGRAGDNGKPTERSVGNVFKSWHNTPNKMRIEI